jgi:hypothetical protein
MKPRYAWEEFSSVAQTYWALLSPAVPSARQHEPDLWTGWEHWVVELARRDAKAGSTSDLSPEHLSWWVGDAIASYEERLRIETEVRGAEFRTVVPSHLGTDQDGRREPGTPGRVKQSPEPPSSSSAEAGPTA